MKRILLAAVLAAFASIAQAQTVAPGKEAWWLRTSFTPTHTEVRGIPVAQIQKGWCKATEFTHELMPKKEMEAEGSDRLMKEIGLTFAVTSNFDRSKTRQTALVGVYQTCAGQKGFFLLVIDEGTTRIRFVAATPSETQFSVLAPDKKDIVVLYCLECSQGDTLRWSAKKKAFGWVKR